MKTHFDFDVLKTQPSDWTVVGEHGDMVVVNRIQKRDEEGKHTRREGRSTSALLSNSSLTQSMWPFWDAPNNGVAPYNTVKCEYWTKCTGKCQVKFSAIVREKKDLYGYVLVDAEQTLRDLVVSIKDKLHMIHRTRDFHNLHLYSIGKSGNEDLNFIIFD